MKALLSKMPGCERVVVLSPAGTTTGRPIKNVEESWLFNRMKILGGKRVGAAADDMEKANEVEVRERARRARRMPENGCNVFVSSRGVWWLARSRSLVPHRQR